MKTTVKTVFSLLFSFPGLDIQTGYSLAFLLRKYLGLVLSPQHSWTSSLGKLTKDCFEMLERVWDWFLDKRGHILSGHVDSGDGPYVGSPSRDLTWHKHYKPPRPKLKYKCKYIYELWDWVQIQIQHGVMNLSWLKHSMPWRILDQKPDTVTQIQNRWKPAMQDVEHQQQQKKSIFGQLF